MQTEQIQSFAQNAAQSLTDKKYRGERNMFCNKCGKPLDDNALFCTNCGNKIKKQASEPVNEIKSEVKNEIKHEIKNESPASFWNTKASQMKS